jgi:dihydroxyacetone kinase
MLDALWPAQRAAREASVSQALHSASEASAQAVERTKSLIAKRGRSSYLRERVLGQVDPGAAAIEIAISAIAKLFTS